MRFSPFAFMAFLGLGLFIACSSGDNEADPVAYGAGPLDDSDDEETKEDKGPEEASDDLPEPSDAQLQTEGASDTEQIGEGTEKESETQDEDALAMYSEPPLPVEDEVKASQTTEQVSEPSNANNNPPQGVGPDASTASDPPAVVQSPGAKWNPKQPFSKASTVIEKIGTYTVRAGDTLAKIAQQVYGSRSEFQKLAQENGLKDPNRLFPGQTLRYSAQVPLGGTSTNTAKISVVKVKPGDTLWGLAEKHLGTPYAWRQFVDWNPEVLANPDRIEPGMTLSLNLESSGKKPPKMLPKIPKSQLPVSSPKTEFGTPKPIKPLIIKMDPPSNKDFEGAQKVVSPSKSSKKLPPAPVPPSPPQSKPPQDEPLDDDPPPEQPPPNLEDVYEEEEAD